MLATKQREIAQDTLAIFNLLATFYAVVGLPTFFTALLFYSFAYGIPFSDIILTLGVAISIPASLALLLSIYVSALLCLPAFYTISIAYGQQNINWWRYLDPRFWYQMTVNEPDWSYILQAAITNFAVIQLLLLITFLVMDYRSSRIIAIQFFYCHIISRDTDSLVRLCGE